MYQVTNIQTDASGRVVAYFENDHNFTVQRGADGRPLGVTSTSACGNRAAGVEFMFSEAGVFAGLRGDLVSALLAGLTLEAMAAVIP